MKQQSVNVNNKQGYKNAQGQAINYPKSAWIGE